MSPELKAFFVFMQAWIDGGCQPNKYGIDTGFALCRAVMRWELAHGFIGHKQYELFNELGAIFNGNDFPFNASPNDFVKEIMSGKVYKNKFRFIFIKEHSQ